MKILHYKGDNVFHEYIIIIENDKPIKGYLHVEEKWLLEKNLSGLKGWKIHNEVDGIKEITEEELFILLC